MSADFLPPGLHRISAERYHADPAERPSLSSGLGRTITLHSPRHAWHESARLNGNFEPETKKEFDIGTAAHTLVLGKGGEPVEIPATLLGKNGSASTTEAKQFIADARACGRTPLKPDEFETILGMRMVLQMRLRDAGIVLDPDRSELAVISEIEGCLCRALYDNAPAHKRLPLYDYKTTLNAHPSAVRKAIEEMGYDHQWIHYVDTWRAQFDEARDFVFIFQEKKAPFEVSIVKLLAKEGHSADWAEPARDKNAKARLLWKECVETGYWPGYPTEILELGASPYYRQRWEEKSELIHNSREARLAQERSDDWQRP